MLPSYTFVDLTGTIIPDTASIGVQVIAEYKAAFGADLITTPDTPQGLLVAGEIASRVAVATNNATLANQINPQQAGGIFLDALLALTGSQRNVQEFTTVTETLTGVPGTPIAAGVIMKSDGGVNFASQASVTLNGAGTASVVFQSVVAGAINVGIGELTTIITPVLGWDSATNAAAGTPGQATQGDEGARIFRNNTLAAQGSGLAEAVTSALYAVLGVRSLKFQENVTSTTLVINNVTMVEHSLWVCVDGGSDDDIANALTNVKGGGCDYNGAVIVPVTNEFSGQVIDVQFDRPTIVPVLIRATISAASSVADPVGTVIGIILAYQQGLINSQPGFVVGAQVSPFQISGAINCTAPTIFVHKLEVSYASPISYQTTELFIEVFEQALTDAGSIQVVVQ